MSLPKRTSVLGLALALFLGIASLTHRTALALREEVPELDRHILVPSPTAARILSAGYTELAADVAWVRTLVYYGDGLVHNTGMPDTDQLVKLVNTLDPHFRYAYVWGAYSVLYRNQIPTEDEYRSSIEIARRALAVFPDDWELNWILGVRLFLDLKTGTPEQLSAYKHEGVTYIERAMHSPNAPADLPILAATFRSQLGQKLQGLRDLREMILNTEDEKARAQLQEKYAALASDTLGHEIADAARDLDARWKSSLPYAPRDLYIMLGDSPNPSMALAASGQGVSLEDDFDLSSSRDE